jgi:hypothetical protein
VYTNKSSESVVKDYCVFLPHFRVQFDDCFLRVITCGFEDDDGDDDDDDDYDPEF